MISVVIPLYNKEASIAQSLGSVLSQSYQDFEVVLVDDGSTDDSVSIVEAMNDPRIRLIKQENGGPSKARNMGVKNARGGWIVFLDADDELLPGALETFNSIINKYPNFDIIDCNEYVMIGNSKTLGFHPIEGRVGNPMKAWFFEKIMPGNARSAFRRDFMLKYLYDERMRRLEDAELLMRQLPNARVYSSRAVTLLFNRNFAEASSPRKKASDDYFAYLDLGKGNFWERMYKYRFYLENREFYPEYNKTHYAKWSKRYDYLLVYKILMFVKKWIIK